MNRRGFFAALVALPALARAPLVTPVTLSGLSAWMPEPGASPFHGVDRTVRPGGLRALRDEDFGSFLRVHYSSTLPKVEFEGHPFHELWSRGLMSREHMEATA